MYLSPNLTLRATGRATKINMSNPTGGGRGGFP